MGPSLGRTGPLIWSAHVNKNEPRLRHIPITPGTDNASQGCVI